jgi:hypothetical protein
VSALPDSSCLKRPNQGTTSGASDASQAGQSYGSSAALCTCVPVCLRFDRVLTLAFSAAAAEGADLLDAGARLPLADDSHLADPCLAGRWR